MFDKLPIPEISPQTFLDVEEDVRKKLSWHEDKYKNLATQLFKTWWGDDANTNNLSFKITLSLRTEGRSSVDVLNLTFVKTHAREATFIIRVYPTVEAAEQEKNIARKLTAADCFPDLILNELYHIPKCVVYRHIRDNIGSSVLGLHHFLLEKLLYKSEDEIGDFARGVREFAKQITKQYQQVEGELKDNREDCLGYYKNVCSQLPPDLVIKGACLDEIDSQVFLVQPHNINEPFSAEPVQLQVTPISQIVKQLSDKNTKSQWLKIVTLCFDEADDLHTAKGDTAYLPLLAKDNKDNTQDIRIWVGIDKEACTPPHLELGKQYELIFFGKDIVTFTSLLQEMQFDSEACLSNTEFQKLLQQKPVHTVMRHNDLHCGNVLASLRHLKAIDLGDMKPNLIASDIARLEVSLWFEVSEQRQNFSKADAKAILNYLGKDEYSIHDESPLVSSILSRIIHNLREGFKEAFKEASWLAPESFENELAYVIQILLFQRYCLLNSLTKISPAFNVFARHHISQFRSGGTAHVELKNEIEVSPVKTAEKVNLCAAIQINLARLKLFTHRYSDFDFSKWETNHLKSVESTYNEIRKHLYKAVMAGQWLYPELLRGIIAALRDFPIQAVLESSHKEATLINNILQDFQTQLNSLDAFNLANRLDKRQAIDALPELAHHIHATVGLGAQEHSLIYETIAQLIVKINGGDTPAQRQIEIRQQFNQWARKTRNLPDATATELLEELIDICPHLLPAREILLDLLQRMDHLLYVLLIFNLENKPFGVVAPIEIKADFLQSKPEPLFYVLGQGTEKQPSWLQLDKDFIRAIETARSQTLKMLRKRGNKPSSKEFKIRVGLPDLRMFQQTSLLYEHESIELPVTLAGFCQYPEMKKTIKLNPAVMLTGPISPYISKAIFLPNLLESLGGIHTLLVTSEGKIFIKDIKDIYYHLRRHGPTQHDYILKDYLESEEYNELFLRHPKVLTFETKAKWNRILIQAKTFKDPIIQTIKRHKTELLDSLYQHKAIQLRGLTGIGKTFLVAQWLEKPEVQNRYGLILYTSVPETLASTPETKQEFVSKWTRKALETLSRELSHRDFDRLALKCRDDPGLLDRSTEFVEALRETLADTQVLWIIDNGQALQYPVHHHAHGEQFVLEHRFAEIIQQVHTGEWQGCELLYITNKGLAEPALPVYPLDEGFTFEEAGQYLDKIKFPFEQLRETVARALGAHPKALELLVKHAKDESVSAAEIEDILTSLPSSTGERALRLTVCNEILEHIFTYLKKHHPKAWWMLMIASTFMRDFNREQFKKPAQKLIPTELDFHFGHDIANADKILVNRSLLSWNGKQRLWNMHSLVRQYSQDIFLDSHSALYRQAHRTAGSYYFPLNQKGWTFSNDAGSKKKYANGESCAAALYHYEQAEYEIGKQAVFKNYYEHPIAKARWWMGHTQQLRNPLYRFQKAESFLKKVFQGYAVGETGDPLVVAVNMVSPDINFLVAKAIHFQRNPKRYEIAVLHYRQALKQGKKEVVPLLASLLCDMAAGQPETDTLWKEAENLFNEVSQSITKNEDVSSYEGLGEMYEKVARRYLYLNPDDPEMPLLILEEAAEANIAWHGLYQFGAKIAKKMGQEREVERWLRTGIDKIPTNVDLYQVLGRFLEQQNKPDEAEEIYKTGIDKNPTNAVLYESLVRFLVQQNKPDEAEKVYKTGIDKSPTNAVLYIALGGILAQQNKLDEAEKVYKTGIDKSPTNAVLYIALGGILAQQNKLDEAEKVYKTGIDKSPTNVDLYQVLGRFLEQQNKPDEAEQIYQKGIEKSPTSEKLYLALGRFLEQQNKPNEAEKVYQAGIEKNPSEQMHIALGRFMEQQNKPDEAEQAYRTGIEKVPTGVQYVALSCLLLRQSRLTEAEETCKIGIKKFPTVYLYLTLGYVLELHKPQEAEDIYRMGIKKFPTAGYLYMALGYLQEEQNRLQEAKDTYKMGIEQAPVFEILHEALEQLERKGI